MWTLFRRRASTRGQRNNVQEPKDTSDDGFLRFKSANPDATYAQFYVSQVMRTLRQGKAHTTIGLRVRESDSVDGVEHGWREAGYGPFLKYRRLCNLRPEQKLVDYGCGSLRLGVNFIEFLDAGHYMGLDVTRDFMDIGASAVPELIASKKPYLHAIDRASVETAAAFGADVVISNAVSYHVHPDETEAYLGNLLAICAKPGSRLVFDVKLSDSAVRFRSRGWAYPLDMYVQRLKPLTLVKQHRVVAVKDYPDAPSMMSAMLEFQRG